MPADTGNPAFERLLGEYRDRVFRLACSLLGDEAAAEDATQDVFLRIWKGLLGFRGDSSVSTWIYAIARNVCLTRRRMAGAHPTSSLEEAAEIQSPTPSAGPDSDLRAAIEKLDARHRDVLVLFYLEERSYQQVALALGLPMGTVKTNLHRAKKELALLLEQQSKRKEEVISWRAVNSKI